MDVLQEMMGMAPKASTKEKIKLNIGNQQFLRAFLFLEQVSPGVGVSDVGESVDELFGTGVGVGPTDGAEAAFDFGFATTTPLFQINLFPDSTQV